MKGDSDEMKFDRDEPGGEMPGVREMTVVQLKSIFTSAHRMVNKEEELKAIVRQANHDLVAVIETARMMQWLSTSSSEGAGN